MALLFYSFQTCFNFPFHYCILLRIYSVIVTECVKYIVKCKSDILILNCNDCICEIEVPMKLMYLEYYTAFEN